jgi:hypothetical protein
VLTFLSVIDASTRMEGSVKPLPAEAKTEPADPKAAATAKRSAGKKPARRR